MAIPFNLPSDEQTEDNYRRLDQLLVDLYSVLRQILVRPTCISQLVPSPNGDENRLRPAPSDARESRHGVLPNDSGRHGVLPDVNGMHGVLPAVSGRYGELPDVVAGALPGTSPACDCPCRRRRRRRRRVSGCCPQEESQRVQRPRDDHWLVVGEQLRKIADEFRTTFRKQQVEKEKKDEDDLKMEVKTSGLFSLLVPSHFRSSLWTTVILLVGWRLLTRTR